MAKITGNVFSFKLDALERLRRDTSRTSEQYEAVMKARITAATALVYNLAHQKRPYISKEHQKKGFRTLSGNIHHDRVSDPSATLGVPVAWKEGGNLQRAIKKEVVRVGKGKYQGTVYVDATLAPYGKDMEYGTSRVHARPFIRPAASIAWKEMGKLFGVKFEVK